MTQTFATDDKNDLFLGDGKSLILLSGLDAIIEACETATKAQLGEMVLATESGIPNFQTIWVGSPNYSLWSSYIRRTLLSIEGVQDVVSLDISARENTLFYAATIKTVFGQVNING